MSEFEDIMAITCPLRDSPLEKIIEGKVRNHALGKEWSVFKFSSPATPSVCDRIFINRWGVVLFIEFKQKDKKLTPKQQQHADELTAHRANVFMIDNIDDGKALVDKWNDVINITTPFGM